MQRSITRLLADTVAVAVLASCWVATAVLVAVARVINLREVAGESATPTPITATSSMFVCGGLL